MLAVMVTVQVQVLTVGDSVHELQVVPVPVSAHEMVPLVAAEVAVSVTAEFAW
jgi:hypothetical protein